MRNVTDLSDESGDEGGLKISFASSPTPQKRSIAGTPNKKVPTPKKAKSPPKTASPRIRKRPASRMELASDEEDDHDDDQEDAEEGECSAADAMDDDAMDSDAFETVKKKPVASGAGPELVGGGHGSRTGEPKILDITKEGIWLGQKIHLVRGGQVCQVQVKGAAEKM